MTTQKKFLRMTKEEEYFTESYYNSTLFFSEPINSVLFNSKI